MRRSKARLFLKKQGFSGLMKASEGPDVPKAENNLDFQLTKVNVKDMDLHTALVTIISLTAVLSFLLLGVNALLNAKIALLSAKITPLRDNQARFENELKEIRTDISDIKKLLYQNQNQKQT